MPRTTTAAMDAALLASQPKFLLLQIDLAAGTERYAFAPIDIAWDGHTWSAITLPIQITEMRDTDSGEATGLQVKFPQINEAAIAEALTGSIRRRKVTVWLGAMDDSNQVVADPFETFSGYGDAIKITYGESEQSITWAIESYEALWGRTAGGRMTDAEHQARYPGDKFFSMVADAVNAQIIWPSKEYWRGG